MVLLPHFIWNCGFTRLIRKRLAARGLAASQNTHSPQIHFADWGFPFKVNPIRLFNNPMLANGLYHHYRYLVACCAE